MSNYPELLLVKVSREMKSEISQRAQRDERPMSAYVRRLLALALAAEDCRNAR